MPDPFDLSQYVTSFKLISDYTPQSFQFADFETEFSNISESIRMRQSGISIGYSIGENAFISVESHDVTSPIALSDSIERFQDAIREFVSGDLIEEYGKLPNCNVYVGFFYYSSGNPIVGVSSIAPNGIDFTPPPDPNVVTNIIDFATEIGSRINELIYALNILTNLHAKMYLSYPLDTDCTNGSFSASSSVSLDSCVPLNDECSNAEEIVVSDFVVGGPISNTVCVQGTTICATIDNGGNPNIVSPNVWYYFHVPSSGEPGHGGIWVDDYFLVKLYIDYIDSNHNLVPDPNWKILVWETTGIGSACSSVPVSDGANSASICVNTGRDYFITVYRTNAGEEESFNLCYEVTTCRAIPPSVSTSTSTSTSMSVDAGPGCLVEGSLITMKDGSLSAIEDLKLGDEVLSYQVPFLNDKFEDCQFENRNDHKFVFGKITHIHNGSESSFYNINDKIKVTYEHPFLAKIGQFWRYIKAENLKIGYFLLNSSGEEVEIKSIEKINKKVKTVNLEIKDFSHFIAESFVVHNASGSTGGPAVGGGVIKNPENDQTTIVIEEASGSSQLTPGGDA